MDPDPTPDPTPFFSDFKDVKKNCSHIFSYNLPAGTISSVLKFKFLLTFCVKIFLATIPLNTFMRNGKDLEPDPYL